MVQPKVTGAPALGALVLGADGPARLAYYAEVMGIPPAGAGQVHDLGPGGPEALALAEAVMACLGALEPRAVRRRLASMRVAAASRLRAADAAARGLRQGTGEVALHAVERSHAGFFAVEVQHLCHRRFDGAMGEGIRREVLVSGDAVTVLPYDAGRDRVLVVEQFRSGPFGRGDPLPWQIEAIAGRIDPGESPEDCARREAAEEAGLSLGALEKVAEYYPSPGALTEYIYSYVALCDLPDDVAGVFGQPEEGEDIKGHLIGFDTLMAAVAGGEVANAPLLLTALWLQRERPRLRKSA